MGEVYRARDSRLNRDVAVKAVRPAVINDVDRVSSLTITAAGGKEMTFAMHAAMVSVTSKAAGAKK